MQFRRYCQAINSFADFQTCLACNCYRPGLSLFFLLLRFHSVTSEQLDKSADLSPHVEQSSVRASATSLRRVACLHLLLLQQCSDDTRRKEMPLKHRTGQSSTHRYRSMSPLACYCWPASDDNTGGCAWHSATPALNNFFAVNSLYTFLWSTIRHTTVSSVANWSAKLWNGVIQSINQSIFLEWP